MTPSAAIPIVLGESQDSLANWRSHAYQPAETTGFVRLPGARHTIFRDCPDLAFPAVRNFVSQASEGQPASY